MHFSVYISSQQLLGTNLANIMMLHRNMDVISHNNAEINEIV